MRLVLQRFVTALVVLALTVVWAVAVPQQAAEAAVPPEPNPKIPDSCGVDVTLVLDASGSINDSNAVGRVRDASAAFLEALAGTDSRARVTQFASLSEELAPPTEITKTALGQGGALRDALNDYYNPKPPRPGNVNWHTYRGGGRDPLSASSYRSRGSEIYTNWDQGLDQAGAGPTKLVVFVTDGRPTAFDFSEPRDPFDQGPPPDVALGGSANPSASFATLALDRAVLEANQIKQAGTRVLAIGVGTALGSSADQNRLKAISGPQVVTDADIGNVDSINDIDVALVRNFDDLADALRGVVLQLCSPSLTVTKLAQTPGDASYTPAQGWDIEVTPNVLSPGTSFDWLLPDTAPGASKTVATQANGTAQFQWEPVPPEADSRAVVQETLQPGYVAGRSDQDDFRCEARDERGNVREITGELRADLSLVLDPIRQEVVTCTIWNSFDYDPQIAVTKVNTPTEVRGDLTPPAQVTSTYEVTNPGNTPLSPVSVTDDKCAPVEPSETNGNNVGDTNGDGKLDTDETWTYTCTRGISTGASTDPAGEEIVNTATATGTPPTGPPVTATTTATVTSFRPGIALEKTADATTVSSGDQVTYTYTVRNTGNLPLGDVSLSDVSTPDTGCTAPTGPTGDAGNDGILSVGEVWRYQCTATLTATTVNTATVTATPRRPQAPTEPFPGPKVTGTSTVTVNTINAGAVLSKTASAPGVFSGDSVTYTYRAENTGAVELSNGDPQGNPGWVTDDRCSPVTQVLDQGFNVGDTNQNGQLSPGETWEFTCTTTLTAPTTNTATIVVTPPVGPALTRTSTVTVDVVTPGIDVVKTALRPVLLDPDAVAELGPDVPPRPAEYEYVVTNTGDVPLSLDANPPTDDTCSSLAFQGGDTDGNQLLDVDETWTYTCSTVLDRDQANAPPVSGGETGTVENTVTVTGVPFYPNVLVPAKSVTATDTARVDVIEPGLNLTKTASADVVLVGDDVTYTFVVTNTGDAALMLIGPFDDKCAPAFQGGDTNGNGLLDGIDSGSPEAWTYTCTRNLGLPQLPATTVENSALVIGVDPLGNNYFGTDTAEVRVFDPAIDLVKTVSESLVPVGTTVTYGFEVRNTGQSPLAADDVLAAVQLGDASDPPQPSCETPTFVGGDVTNPGFLDRLPAETWRYTCTATIDAPTTNIAFVLGIAGTTFTPPIPVPLLDADAAFVQPFQPGIAVTKTADPTALLGAGPVTYTYEVTNTGDVPLADVKSRIADDTCSPVTFVGGDDDGDGLLDTPTSIFEDSGDETWVFTCTTTVSQTTTNTVDVPGTPTNPTGTPLCGPNAGPGRVTAPCDIVGRNTATVTVTAPGTIVVEKDADPADGQDFAFEFDDGAAPQAFTLQDGGTQTFGGLQPGSYTVDEALPDGWDLARLACDDPSGGTTTTGTLAEIGLDAGETVTCTYSNVELSAIVVEKVTETDSTQPFAFSTTAGESPSFELTAGSSRTIAALSPGSYTVTEDVPAGWTLSDLTCVDPSGGTTPSGSTATVDLASGEIVTCTFTNAVERTSQPPTASPPVTTPPATTATPSGSGLPFTGFGGGRWVLLVGFGLMVLGAVAVVTSWRRRRPVTGSG